MNNWFPWFVCFQLNNCHVVNLSMNFCCSIYKSVNVASHRHSMQVSNIFDNTVHILITYITRGIYSMLYICNKMWFWVIIVFTLSHVLFIRFFVKWNLSYGCCTSRYDSTFFFFFLLPLAFIMDYITWFNVCYK